VRIEADRVPFGVHVDEPHHREPRLADERGDPAPRARRRRAAAAGHHQRGHTVSEEGQEKEENGEVGQLPRRAWERDLLLQLQLRLDARHGRAGRLVTITTQLYLRTSTGEPQENIYTVSTGHHI